MAFFTQGVKYIKIARYDAFGNDNYQSLRELDNIRINTVDRGIIDYPVATITEYPSSSLNGPYFLYQIVTTNITSSTNNQILNYRVSASSAGPISDSFGMQFPATEIGTKVINYTENIDNQGYFNPANGNYVLGNTPNIPLVFTASCAFNYSGAPGSNSTVYLNFIQGDSYLGRIKLVSGSGTSGTLSMSGSFTSIESQTYSLYVGTEGDTMDFTNIDLKITQSIPPVAGIGAQTILEPYITTPFINSDYDVLMNNAVINRPNSFFLDVDFTDSQILPINQQAILSSSATPAVIQDSYYSSNWWASSRYNGQQLSNQKYNVWSKGDFTPDKVSNVQNLKTYFVRFNWLAGTSPEWGNNFEGKTNVSIKYIIDENGNEIPPIFDENDINLSIVQSAFGGYYNPGGINPAANATVLLSNPDSFGVNLDAVNYTIPVFRAGQRIRPIAYTQTASYDSNGNVIGFGYTGSINFVQGDTPNDPLGSANDYRLLAFANDGLNLFSSNTLPNNAYSSGLIKWNPPIQLGASASFATSSTTPGPSTGSIYKPTGSLGQLSGSGYILNLKASIDFDYDLKNNDIQSIWEIGFFDSGLAVDIKLMKDNNVLTTQRLSLSLNEQGTIKDSANRTLSYTDYSATTSSLYSVAYDLYWSGQNPIDGAINIKPTSYFQVTQYPAPNTGPVTKFWMTGSNSNSLFARRGEAPNVFGLNDVWGQKQQNINNSGFDPIVYDFEPQAGDEIRFQGVEQQAYIITQVTQSVTQSGAGAANYNALTLTLDRQISNNINTDYFLIRRYIPDPGNIILDISKPAGQTSDGILIPEFLGKKATETKEKIISLLRTQS